VARIETSILIDRPIGQVFAYVANPENLPKWADRTYDVTITSAGPIAVGTTFLAVGRFLGQRLESPQEIIEYAPNQRYALRSIAGPIAFVFRYTVETEGDGTRIDFAGEVQAGLFSRWPSLSSSGPLRAFATPTYGD
jgi:uncharacterized membrane protein